MLYWFARKSRQFHEVRYEGRWFGLTELLVVVILIGTRVVAIATPASIVQRGGLCSGRLERPEIAAATAAWRCSHNGGSHVDRGSAAQLFTTARLRRRAKG